MRNFLIQMYGILLEGLLLFTMFLLVAIVVGGTFLMIFGSHDMIWLRVVGVLLFIFLLGLTTRV